MFQEKLKIRQVVPILIGPPYWVVTRDKKILDAFNNFTGAQLFVKLQINKELKEMAAYSRAMKISVNLLSVEEYTFIKELLRKKCIGITKRQYGWLCGIYERQQAEW